MVSLSPDPLPLTPLPGTLLTLDTSAGGHYSCEEPSIAEVSPGNLLLFHRTPVGRLFQSWSSDNGTTWSLPEPTALASSRAPAALMRIPGTDDLLTIWNQASADEIERGLQRHRLTSAISKDGGGHLDQQEEHLLDLPGPA